MSFKKDGETKVYKTKKVSPKFAEDGDSRYTVDDLVKDSIEEEQKEELEEEDLSDE